MPDFISPLFKRPEEEQVYPQPLTPTPPTTLEEATKMVESGQPAPPAESLGLPPPMETPKPPPEAPPVKVTSDAEALKLIQSGIPKETVDTMIQDQRALAEQEARKTKAEYVQTMLKDSEPASVEQWQAAKQKEEHDAMLENSVMMDPLELFDDEQLAKDKNFSIESYVQANPSVMQDNKKVARLSEMWRKRFMEPITTGDVAIGTGKLLFVNAPMSIYHLFKGTGSMIADVLSGPVVGLAGELSGQPEDFFVESNKLVEKNLGADLAGLEQSGYNFFGWAKDAPKRALRRLGYDKWEDVPAERLQQEFRNSMAEFLQGQKFATGEAEDPFFKAYTQSVIDENGNLDTERVQMVAQADPAGFLAFSAVLGSVGEAAKAAKGAKFVKAGKDISKLRSTVARMQQTLPANSYARNMAEKALADVEGRAGAASRVVAQLEDVSAQAQKLAQARFKASVTARAAELAGTEEAKRLAQASVDELSAVEAQIKPLSPSRAVAKAKTIRDSVRPSAIAQRAVGRTMQGTGSAVRFAGRIVQALPSTIVGGIALNRVLAGDYAGAIFALVGGRFFHARRLGRLFRRPIERWGLGLNDAGRRVATSQPNSMAQKAVIGLSQGSGEILSGALKGMPMDIGFGLALAQTPDDVRDNLPAFGTALGALGAAGGPTRRFVEQIKAAPMEIQSTGPVRREGPAASIRQGGRYDRDARTRLSKDGNTRVNAVERFLENVGSDTPVYVMPSSEAFLDILTQQFRAKNNREPNAKEMADLRNYSQQRGMFSEQIIGDNGQQGSAIFVTDLEAAPHEGAHDFQNVLGESGNQQVDQLVMDHYGDRWEDIGAQYTSMLTGNPPNRAWRGDLQSVIPQKIKDAVGGDPVAAADVYLAREIAAENFSTLFSATGGLPEGDPGLLYKLANVIDTTSRYLGVNMLSRFRTPGLGLPVEGGVMSALQKQAQAQAGTTAAERAKAGPPPTSPGTLPSGRPVIPPKPPKGAPPATTEDEQAAGEEAKSIADEAPDTTLPGAKMTQREILGAAADAIARGEGVQTAYRSAPEAPGADTEALRVERRKEIEAARNMPEDVRRMVFNTGFPYKIEVTRNGVTQILQWSPDMLASNAVRWAKKLSELARKEPNAPELVELEKLGFELDIEKGDWTADTWRRIVEDANVFSENQRMGFTGSGGHLNVPNELRASGLYAPPETGLPIQLDQGESDFINLLYNLRVPSTPRISGKGLPRNISAQEISKHTLPGRVVPPAALEPGEIPKRRLGEPEPTVRERFGEMQGPKPEKHLKRAEELGIVGREILEVNPLRASLEKALQRHEISLPEGIEVIQRLNLEHIASMTTEPNLPRTAGGNALTLQAGFLPALAEPRAGQENDPRRIVEAALRDPNTGEIVGRGVTHFLAMLDGMEHGTIPEEGGRVTYDDGFVNAAGEFRTRDQAFEDALDVGQLTPSGAAVVGVGTRKRQLEAQAFAQQRQFLPRRTESTWMDSKGEEYSLGEAADHAYTVSKLPGGENFSSVQDAFKKGFARVAAGAQDELYVNIEGRKLTSAQEEALIARAERTGMNTVVADYGGMPHIIWEKPEASKQFLPAEAAGATKENIGEARKEWREKGTASSYFQRWFGESVVRDANDKPLQVFHGTTHTFTVFDPLRGNIENDLGQGIYFSSNENEVAYNYLRTGPDLRNRIESLTENIRNRLKEEGTNLSEKALDREAERLAKKELVGRRERTLPVYLKLENPVVIGDQYSKPETEFTIEIPYDESGEFIPGREPTGTLLDFIKGLDAAEQGKQIYVGESGVIHDALIQAAMENGGFLKASDLIEIIKHQSTEITDENGGYAVGEYIRQGFENMGFDGIVDSTVSQRFRRMEGMTPDTTHFIAFRPEQVKSAKGRGTFNPENPDYRFLPKTGAQLYQEQLARKTREEGERYNLTPRPVSAAERTRRYEQKVAVNKANREAVATPEEEKVKQDSIRQYPDGTEAPPAKEQYNEEPVDAPESLAPPTDAKVNNDKQQVIVPAQFSPRNLAHWKEDIQKYFEERKMPKKEIDRRMSEVQSQFDLIESLYQHENVDELFPESAGLKRGTIPTPEGIKLGLKPSEYGPVRANMDPLYVVSIDLTAECVRRLDQRATQLEIMRQLNRPLSDEETMNIVLEMKSQGKTAPCVFCYVESPRRKMSNMLTKWKDIFNGNTEPKEKYKEVVEAFRKKGINGENIDWSHHLNPEVSGTEPADNPEVTVGGKTYKLHNFLGQQTKAMVRNPDKYEGYEGQLLKFDPSMREYLNERAGLRFFSNSDFQPEHIPDMMQIVHDANTAKQKMHGFTKQPAFVDIYGDTGLKVNQSVFLKSKTDFSEQDIGHEEAKKYYDQLDYDQWQSFPWELAMENRGKYADVGSTLVATDDVQIWWALDNEGIDQIIPFHASGLPERYSTPLGWKDYTHMQHEAWQPGYGPEIPEGATPDVVKRAVDAYRNSLPEKYRLSVNGKGQPVLRQHQFMDLKNGTSNAEAKKRYLALCKKLGIIPVFRPFVGHPNYIKLRKDFARTDTPFRVPEPKFDMKAASDVIKQWIAKGGTDPKPDMDIVNALVPKYQKTPGGLWASERLAAAGPRILTPEEIKSIRPMTGPGQKSVAQQITEIKRRK